MLYGRRKGRPLSETLQGHLDDGLAAFGIDEETFKDLPSLFSDTYNSYILEIGFGGGEHLAHQAALHPDTGFIGAEPFINGVAALCRALISSALKNVRIYPNNVFDLVSKMAPNSLQRIYILFPDPWPKKRHSARRLIAKASLQDFYRVLKPGGEIIIATDHADYFEWITETVLGQGQLQWVNQAQPDIQPQQWVQTRYQEKAIAAERPSKFITLLKPESA